MSFGLTAEYLGWKPASGIYGRQFADPVLHELMEKRRRYSVRLKRHSVELVGKKKLKIAELPPEGRALKPLRYPSIPITDITYVQQEDGRTDPLVFCLILLGYNEESSHSVHLHAWRGRSLEAVSEFVARLNKCLTTRDHLQLVRQREHELLQTREIQPSGLFLTERRMPPMVSCPARHLHLATGSAASAALSTTPSSSSSSAATGLPAELQSVTEELKRKLRDLGNDSGGGSQDGGAPLLHPPRDYDSAARSHGVNAAAIRSEAPLRAGSRAPSGVVIRSPAASQAIGANSDNAESESDEGEESEDQAALFSGIGGAATEAWADPGRGFSTWRRRMRRRQMIAATTMQQQQQQKPPT